MARPGRRPKPAHIKLLEGVKEDRINRLEPTPAESEVVPPRPLTDAAMRHWNALAPDLVARRVMTSWDADVLARYCEWLDRYEQLAAEMELTGFTVEGRLGGEVKNPRWQLLRDSSEQVTRLGALLGLNPSDRSRLKVDDSDSNPSGPERLLS